MLKKRIASLTVILTLFLLSHRSSAEEASKNLEDLSFHKTFSFVEVLPGKFIMGSDPEGPEKLMRHNDEFPHPVEITKPFEMEKFG
jgi:hypothetical protein